ncbi:MAG TPA: hypothetical protein VKF41_06780, partial [Bryobacteraceae bacterium]|nr:hypothetical protein [Bryobacteraceae bacterium]
FLGPQVASGGALYYVRRPFGDKPSGARPLGALKDAALLPIDVVLGILGFLTYFAALFGRKRPGWPSPEQRAGAVGQIQVWGETIAIGQAPREGARDGGDAPSLVPSSWQLVRQSPAGAEVLAKGILSFDIAPDGSVLYSNGRAVHHIGPDGATERVHVGNLIQQVAAL